MSQNIKELFSTHLELDASVPAYLAISACRPNVGSNICYFQRYNPAREVWECFGQSSEITEVSQITSSIYGVRTINSFYILQVI